MSSDLSRLPFLIRLSRATMRVIWQNLIFGVLYIVVAQALVVLLGQDLPLWAALFMHVVSSTLVCFNSARLVRFGEETGYGMEAAPPPAPATAGVPRLSPA
jgi:Cd2+/Zn2+-exporting ATPase